MSGQPRQDSVRITREMLVTARRIYTRWESDHIFGEFTPAAPYAVEELARELFREMAKVSKSHALAEI
jgi:hypothetical protein